MHRKIKANFMNVRHNLSKWKLTILHTMINMKKTIKSNFFSFRVEKSVLERGYMSFKSQQFLLCKCVLCIKLIAFIMYVKLIINHTELVVIIENVFYFLFSV